MTFPATEATLLIIFASVQIIGLASLCGARATSGTLAHACFRTLFLCSLLAVGLATMCAISCHSGWWLSCGATLAAMAIGGTLDLKSAEFNMRGADV
jgi:hypothetical protein